MQLPLYARVHLGGDYTVNSEQYSAVGISSFSESHEICFDVATSDDAVSEGTEIETFQLLLSTDVSWVMLDIPHEVTVDIVILDNDGKCENLSIALLVREPPLVKDTLEMRGVLYLEVKQYTKSISTGSKQVFSIERCSIFRASIIRSSIILCVVVEVEFEQSVYIKTEGAFPYLSLCLTVSGGVDRHPPPSLTINTNSRTAVGEYLKTVPACFSIKRE